MLATRQDRRYRRYQCRVQTGPGPGRLVWHSGSVLAFVLLVSLAFVWCRSAETKMNRRMVELREQYKLKLNELKNLQIDLEHYRGGKHVLTAVEQFELELHPPVAGQVRRIIPDNSGRLLRQTTPPMLAERSTAATALFTE